MAVAGMVRGVSRKILHRIQGLLHEDGFKEPNSGIFINPWKGDWNAWIGIDGSPFALNPRVGVFNKELQDLRRQALEMIDEGVGRASPAPPLIMVNLEQLIGDDVDCVRRTTWQYKGDEHKTGYELEANVADDLVYCLRAKAYPFFDRSSSFDAVYNAARIDKPTVAVPSPALPFYLPIILLKTDRHEDLERYVKSWVKQYRSESSARRYERYINALVETMSASPTK